MRLALDLRVILDDVGLLGFPKTSGQKGLHVLVPLGPGVNFDTAKLLVELLGRLVTDKNPTIATMERRVNQRGSRVYVDTGQTGPSRTIVAPVFGALSSRRDGLDAHRLERAARRARYLALHHAHVARPRARGRRSRSRTSWRMRPDVPAAVKALSKYL